MKVASLPTWLVEVFMHSLRHRVIFYIGLILFLAIVSAGTTISAFATLTESGPTSVSATAVNLNGTNKTTTYSLGLTVANTPSGGNGAGWNLTITSTTFTSGSHTLSTTASTINAAPTAACNSGCPVSPTNTISYPMTVPAGSSPPAAVKFFDATAGTGKNTGSGSYTITPTITIAIPANTFAGTYTSTVNVTIVSGP